MAKEKKTKAIVRYEFEVKDRKYRTKDGEEKTLKSKTINNILNIIVAKSNKLNPYGYADIHSTFFGNSISNYKNVLFQLENFVIIEKDNYYEKGSKSIGYRITNEVKEKLRLTNINYSTKTAKPKIKTPVEDMSGLSYDEKKRLLQDFKNCEVDFNLNKFQINYAKFPNSKYIDINKWAVNNYKLQKFKDKRLFYSWTRNRLYSNFTSISSQYRIENIKLNNEPIVEFDISNSFPLMLAILTLKTFPHFKDEYDFKQYCSEVVDGNIYRTIQKKLNNLRNVGKSGEIGVKGQELSAPPFSLSDTKSLFQVFINGNTNVVAYSNERQSDIKDIMKYNYPEIYEIVEKKYADEVKIYDDLVIMETTFIFDIIKELYDKYPDIKILTCHDAIYVPKSYQDKTKEIWDRRFLKLIKDLPVISEAAFSQSHLDIMEDFMSIDDDDDDDY